MKKIHTPRRRAPTWGRAKQVAKHLFIGLFILSAFVNLFSMGFQPKEAEAAWPVIDIDNLIEAQRQLAELQAQYAELQKMTATLSSGNWIGLATQAMASDPSDKMGGLAYTESTTSGEMATTMPGYEAYADYPTEAEARTAATMETLQKAMDALYEHHETIPDDTRLNDLLAQAEAAEGIMQVSQVQAQLLAEVATELKALRQINATGANANIVAWAHMIDRPDRGAALSVDTGNDLKSVLGF